MFVQSENVQPSDTGSQGYEDSRTAPRFALLIRSAKLLCRYGEFLCVIRDISETGVKLRLFHPLPANEPLRLEFSTGDSIPITQVWSTGNEAGFEFTAPIDIHHIIAEASPYPKRALRLRLRHPATINFNGASYEATISDLSRQGACIETRQPLALEQKLTLDMSMVPSLAASVRWRNSSCYGLALQHIFSFEELARTIARMQLPAELSQLVLRCPELQRRF
jgi:hypothetical protein